MQKIGLSSFQLKFIALLFMTLDNTVILLNQEPFPYYHIFSRFVGALFAYLLVQGFFHTSDRAKYFIRLAAAGIIMWAGNKLVAYLTGNDAPIGHSMFLTLAAGFGAIWIFQWSRKNAETIQSKLIAFTAAAVVAVIAMIYTEGGFCIIPVIVASYFLYGKKWWLSLVIIVISAILAVTSITYSSSGDIQWDVFFAVNCDWAMVTVIPFILLYNGRRGPKNGFAKWMFYVYYPLHIWVFTIVGTLLQQ
ncbi:conjugal transfer protein TraX [Anaerovorax odorimutans]|uniref:Conjugal transfer protein TraX n=1 Tax=Anaerovorax odorimutans TaxID=109327 RepID=A0ABT1RJT7_9FIRM|nr:TraX family protein [Anaerovorax odorimutans]MCQ4635447.1 conjugal transfer protein TraX [Anaerovorax odorimutans]